MANSQEYIRYGASNIRETNGEEFYKGWAKIKVEIVLLEVVSIYGCILYCDLFSFVSFKIEFIFKN